MPEQNDDGTSKSINDGNNSGAAAAEATNLPSMISSIWDSPFVNKYQEGITRVWECLHCPKKRKADGTVEKPKPFGGWNATKAIYHTNKITGQGIRPCDGHIPPAWAKLYWELLVRNTKSKEERRLSKVQLSVQIDDT